MRPLQIFLISVVLIIALPGCNNDQENSSSVPTDYRFLVDSEQGLFAVNPRNPNDAVNVDPELTALSGAMMFPQYFGEPPDLTVKFSYAVYEKNGRYYRIHLPVDGQISPVPVSNFSQADTVCSVFHSSLYPYTNSGTNNLRDLRFDITLPGDDGECFNTVIDGNMTRITPSADNISATIHLGMSASEPPIMRPRRYTFRPDYGLGDVIESFTSGEEKSQMLGILSIEDQVLYWYPDSLQANKQALMPGATSMFTLGVFFIHPTDGWLYLVQIDNELYGFNNKTAELQSIHAIQQADTSRMIPYLGLYVDNTSNDSPLVYFIDDNIVYEIRTIDISQIQVKQISASPIHFAENGYLLFVRIPGSLLIYDGDSYFTMDTQNGGANQLVPAGYGLFDALEDYGVFYSADTTLVVDWRGQERMRLASTTIQSRVEGMDRKNKAVITTKLGNNTTTVSIFDIEQLANTDELGVIPTDRVGKQWSRVRLTETGDAIWSVQLPNVSGETVYITNVTDPGTPTEVLPELTGKLLVD